MRAIRFREKWYVDSGKSCRGLCTRVRDIARIKGKNHDIYIFHWSDGLVTADFRSHSNLYVNSPCDIILKPMGEKLNEI